MSGLWAGFLVFLARFPRYRNDPFAFKATPVELEAACGPTVRRRIQFVNGQADNETVKQKMGPFVGRILNKIEAISRGVPRDHCRAASRSGAWLGR